MFVEKHYRNNLPMYFTTEVGAAKNTTRMRLESGRRIRKQKGTIGSVYSRLPPVTSCAFYCRLRAFAAGRTTTYATKAHLNLDIATKFGAGASSRMRVPFVSVARFRDRFMLRRLLHMRPLETGVALRLRRCSDGRACVQWSLAPNGQRVGFCAP